MTIRIVTDSTCDIPEALAREHGIEVIPLFVHFGADESYRDGVDLTRAEFYHKLPDYPQAPTTAAPGPEVFRRVYDRLALSGATEVISIHISISLSATLNSARLAAESTTSVPVTVLDSRQLSMGTGFLALEAAKAASGGASNPAIMAMLEKQIERTYVFAALDTLEYLQRSGRMNWAAAKLGNLLKIKPLLYMYDGEPTAHRVRTAERAVEQLMIWLKALVPLERIALLHSIVPERAQALREQVQALLPDLEIPLMTINPVIGAHIGPGVLGFTCIQKEQE